ncbi:MAG: hypothetical protein F6K41_15565 [Symploca sp. SIO3E6]|nr:hypothetical protein [Caldora sp. SIO3E6]
MTNSNRYNYNNGLARKNRGQLQKSSSNSIVQVAGAIVKAEESVKIAWSHECNKADIISAELEAWMEYDSKY